jgi:hypothetical protein
VLTADCDNLKWSECAKKYHSHHTLPLELPTPINPGILLRYFQDYDQEGTNYVVNGFTQGFSVSCLDFKTTLNCRKMTKLFSLEP